MPVSVTTPAAAGPGRTAIVTVDDDPGVSRAVARDLRRRYGEQHRIVRAESGKAALDALREEFPELDPTLEALRAAGKTPFPRTDLPRRELPEEDLAVEVGLVSRVVGANNGEPDRFWVPELYRIALGLTRRGQV